MRSVYEREESDILLWWWLTERCWVQRMESKCRSRDFCTIPHVRHFKRNLMSVCNPFLDVLHLWFGLKTLQWLQAQRTTFSRLQVPPPTSIRTPTTPQHTTWQHPQPDTTSHTHHTKPSKRNTITELHRITPLLIVKTIPCEDNEAIATYKQYVYATDAEPVCIWWRPL
jgi:hypothetical protein